MYKIFRSYILFLFFSSAGIFAFADEPSSALDDKPSVDTAATSGVDVPAVPSDAANTQPSYLYDLKKLIAKSRENIKEVNEKIKEQAVLKRNQKREERAREYYEKGVELTNEGKLDEARDYFEKAIRITEHPEMAGYIKESQIRLRKQEAALSAQERQRYSQIKEDENVRKQDVEEAYREAVDLYKQKKYHPAKDAFEHVDEIAPDYRATDSYLKILDQDIITEDAQVVKQQAVEVERQQKEAEEARAKEKAMWLAQIEEKEKEHKEAIDKQAAEVYDEAVELYKNKKFAEAKKKFEEVSWVIPDYKSTMRYLGRIDKDAQEEQERVAEQQQKALQEQRWEEEVERKKQEAEQQKELEVKTLQHQKDLQEQAQFLYSAAVRLFDKKDMDEALAKFNDIEKTCPDFKSTRVYIARIKQWQFDEQVRLADTQKQAQAESLRQKVLADQRQRAQELKDKADQAQNIYTQALQLYRDHQWEESKAQFESVEKIVPDFKHTRRYLQKIDTLIAKNAKVKPVAVVPVKVIPPSPVIVAAPVVAPLPVKMPPSPVIVVPSVVPPVTVSLEDQQKQAQDISALAEKSAQLYQQVADIDNNGPTGQMKRKMAEVDKILNNLKESKERLLRQMQEEQFKRQEEESKAKREESRLTAQKMYQDAVGFYRSHDYANAKVKFLALENVIPDYKATRRYLSRVEDALKKAGIQSVADYEKRQAEHLKHLQENENVEELSRTRQEREAIRKAQEQQQAQLQNLAQKASDINDDIIRLSKTQDYAAMKAKFNELENTVSALTALKDEMTHQKSRQENEKVLTGESDEDRNKMIRIVQGPLKEKRPVVSNQPAEADQFKRREIMQEQNDLFREGVNRYGHKKYTEAKLLFGELADQHDRRAEVWLKKVDRAITRELLKSQEGEERERTAFIADQLKAQRELALVQERELQRQKKLTEELERQKRLFDDDRMLQLRKEETMKVQERERQLQEAKRSQLEKQREKQQEELRFHKIEIVVKPKPVIKSKPIVKPVLVVQAKPIVKQKPAAVVVPVPAVIVSPVISQQDQKREEREEREERQQQAQLRAQRQTIRKQLEDGVEAMYQEALSLYRDGDYATAADRFKDVQDILPGYKRSVRYMDEARQKSLNENPAVVPASTTVSHGDNVTKALDLFDPNAK